MNALAAAGRSLLGRVALLAFAACSREPGPPGRPPPGGGYALREVVAPRIAELERACAGESAAAAVDEDPDLVERVRGLVPDLRAGPRRLRTSRREELATIGDPALPALDVLLAEADRRGDAETTGSALDAIEALGAIATKAGDERLLSLLEGARRPPWRAVAAWQLARPDRAQQDRWLPRLLLRLKYEIDGETVVSIAAALAARGSSAGVDGLRVVAAEGTDDEARAAAAALLQELVARAGAKDGEALARSWREGALERSTPPPAPSPRLELEVWRTIARLGVRDLRAVDDARFVLARLGPCAVRALCETLHERDVYLRVHAAQCLERIGRRGADAAPALLAALAEPRLAPAAAAALGATGDRSALEPLLACLAPAAGPELASAAARALGALGDARALPSLLALCASDAPLALRQTAAESVEALGAGESVLALFAVCLEAPLADAAGAEASIERILAARAAEPGHAEPSRELFARWRALGGTGGEAPRELDRRRARAALVRGSTP